MLAKSTILIVDDDQELCYLLASVLQTMDADIFQAYTIGDASLIIENINPSLVLLDHRLPDGLGLQFVSIINQLHPNTKVILMTGENSRILRQTAFDVGCMYFLIKPFDAGELVKLVRHVVDLTNHSYEGKNYI